MVLFCGMLQVACRQMGFTGGYYYEASSDVDCHLFGSNPLTFWLDEVTCSGSLHGYILIPPALAEEVIFLVASVCLCVCQFAYCRLIHWTYGPKSDTHTHFKRTIISSYHRRVHRSKAKVTKVKNATISVLSQASENVVQCQGHEGQGHKSQGQGHTQGQRS